MIYSLYHYIALLIIQDQHQYSKGVSPQYFRIETSWLVPKQDQVVIQLRTEFMLICNCHFDSNPSGKTAAFALPILQLLSEDPFGIYCLILTPTRELAIQINEQFLVLGALFGIRTCLVLGGVGMTDQSLELSKLPHIGIITYLMVDYHSC
jgi:hypothetical protein